MTADYVRIRDLPDLQPGDLLLVHDRPMNEVYPLYFVAPDRAMWLHVDVIRREIARGDDLSEHSPQFAARKVREIARMRCVLRTDLADDRWPETERKLCAHAAASPAPPPAPKIGDVLTDEQVAALPVGTALGDGSNLLWLKVPQGWLHVAVCPSAMGWHGMPDDPRPQPRGGPHVLAGFGVPAGPTRVDVARALAAQGYAPAVEALREAGLEARATPPASPPDRPALKVGDAVKRWGDLPAGAIVADDSNDIALVWDTTYVWLRIGGKWTDEGNQPRLIRPPKMSSCNRRVVALGLPYCTPERARELVEAAEAGATPTEVKPPPLRPGDLVGDRWSELPPGSVVDVRDGTSVVLAVRGVTGWSWADIQDEEGDPVGPTSWEGAWRDPDPADYPHAVLVGQVTVGAMGEQFTSDLAACGYEPAVERMREIAAARAPAPPASPPLAVGDRVPLARLAELPVGAVVAQTTEGDEEYVARKTPDGWICTLVDPNFTPSFELASHWTPLDGVKLLALDCTAEDRVGFTQQFAAAGHGPAQQWLRRHGHEVPAPEPEPAPVRLRDVPPGTLVQIKDGSWCYRLPNGSGWWVTSEYDRKEIAHGRTNGWEWSPTWCAEAEVLRQIPAQPADLAPGAWERLTGEAPPVPAPEPALPEAGATLTRKQLDALPAGAVIEEYGLWFHKCDNGKWRGVSSLPNAGLRAGVLSAEDFDPTRTRFVGVGPMFGDDLRAWCAARGYSYTYAIDAERKLTEAAAGPATPSLDAAAATQDHEDMATTQRLSTVALPGGVTITQHSDESVEDFAQRVEHLRSMLTTHPAAPRTQEVVAPPAAAHGLARVGAALKGWGAGVVGDGARAVVNQKALAAVDVGRVAGAQALAAGVEALLGPAAATAVLRAAQSPIAPLVVDGAVSVGAALAGADDLSRIVRGRFVRRVVEGSGEALVERGVDAARVVVTQLARAVGAIGAAAQAAGEIPEQAETTEGAQAAATGEE